MPVHIIVAIPIAIVGGKQSLLLHTIKDDGRIVDGVDLIIFIDPLQENFGGVFVPEYDNLSLINAGTLPDNPTELISNDKAEALLEYLNGLYDMVIIDTSPIVLVTDGYLLSRLCDATLYVIRHEYAPKKAEGQPRAVGNKIIDYIRIFKYRNDFAR